MGAEDFFRRGDMIIFWENLGWRKKIFSKFGVVIKFLPKFGGGRGGVMKML